MMFKKNLLATALLSLSLPAQSQPVLVAPVAPTAALSPDVLMPAGQFYVNPKSAPGRRFGVKAKLVGPSPGTPEPTDLGATDRNGGDWRTGCKLSHVAKDDPIVWPGQTNKTHYHAFYGNTTTGPNSDPGRMTLVGNSTCSGGILNRTGYWVMTLVYHCPVTEVGCDRKRDGEIIVGKSGVFYYKNTTGFSSDTTEWFPAGFRFIAGDPTNTNPASLPGRIECYRNGLPISGPNGEPPWFDHIPTQAEADARGGCNGLNLFIQGPQCSNGQLDSPDHKSHTRDIGAYASFYIGCAAAFPTHPINHPSIILNVHVEGIGFNDFNFLRFSSDQPKATATGLCATAEKNWCAGASLHMDWANGWDQTTLYYGKPITQYILENCYNKGRVPVKRTDCSVNKLGAVDGVTQWTLQGP